MLRNLVFRAGVAACLGLLVATSACSSSSDHDRDTSTSPTCPSGASCAECVGDACSGATGGISGATGGTSGKNSSGGTAQNDPEASDGIKDGSETDVDCGGPNAPKCGEGKACLVDGDCEVACSYAKACVSAPSCTIHLGGDTCGIGEVGSAGLQHESCCRTLPVSGYADPAHPGKTVYVDKYEITAGRIRNWVARLTAERGGKPDVAGWINDHTPVVWDHAWDKFLPASTEGPTVVIARRLLGDPRPEDNGESGPPGPGVILPPPTDEPRNMGTNYQFGSSIYADLHGNDCGIFTGSYGFSTYWYSPDILARDGQQPRVDGVGYAGETIPAQDALDVKSMNCITNAMLAAFCAWDGGQLVTDEVLDHITASPASLGNVSGCGTQHDNHGNLLDNNMSGTVQTGGRCPNVIDINATFDAGDDLPVPNSPLNVHNYHYPDLGNSTADKSWEISAPGRVSLATTKQTDLVRINSGDEPWVDLAGNLSEAALDMNNGAFTGLFAMKYRGVGYGSARSDLNTTLIKGETVLRIQRPEAKGGYTGGRCMRFK